MAGRGMLVAVAAAVGLGAGVLALRGVGTPNVKLPGPCEVVRTMPDLPAGMPPMPPERTVYGYDLQGRKRLEQRMWGDDAGESTRWEHDAMGRVVLEERNTPGPIHHTDVDGTQRVLDHRRMRLRFTYDDAGRMLTRAYEPDGDGVVQALTRYAYDAAGRQASAHAEWEGKYTSDTTFEHDAEGRLVAERSDGDAPATKRYEHDERGRVVKELEDFMADGTIDRTVVRRLDDEDRLLSEHLDEGFMGSREIDYTYDEAGNVLTRRERVLAPEPGPTVLDTYDYRCWTLQDGTPVDGRTPPEP